MGAFGSKADSAETQSCCAWVMPSVFNNVDKVIAEQQSQSAAFNNVPNYCGFDLRLVAGSNWQANHHMIQEWCCNTVADAPINPLIPAHDIKSVAAKVDCGDPNKLEGFAAAAIVEFAEDEAAWLVAFKEAWKKATERGTGADSATG